jgi:hypothetical protein
MVTARRPLARLSLASLIAACAGLTAQDANAACDPSTLTCAVAGTALSAQIDERLPTEIDSGWMEKGSIKVRTRFTIDPVRNAPLLAVDMPDGAMVEASWPEPGYVTLRPVAGDAVGTASVRFALVPSLEAQIYGVGVNYNAAQLVNMVPGGSFNYDSSGEAPFVPWGFEGVEVQTPAPALDRSTLFALPFSRLGVSPSIAEGTLSIQAATKPTFRYVTKEIRLDGNAFTGGEGGAKIPVGDADALDVSAQITGELSLSGTLDVRPVVKVDTVGGYPTFGLVKFSFSAVSKSYGGAPMAMAFAPTTIHIPLPNVKVPKTSLDMGVARAGTQVEGSVSIASTGELGSILRFESSSPEFVVPTGEVRVAPKSQYDLVVAFRADSDLPASATITVRSNDPDSPEQTFRVGANGADLGDDEDGPRGRVVSFGEPPGDGGCSLAGGTKGGMPSAPFGALALAAAAAAIVRRQRRACR